MTKYISVSCPLPSFTGPHQAATSQEARITVRGGPAEGYFLILGYPWILMYTYFLHTADINLITTQSTNERARVYQATGKTAKGHMYSDIQIECVI